MIDPQVAINYLQEMVNHIKQEDRRIELLQKEIDQDKLQMRNDMESFIAKKSSFYEQTAAMTQEIEKSRQMSDLASKMKVQIDLDRQEIEEDRKLLAVRLEKVKGLEKREEQIALREKTVSEKEIHVAQREETAINDVMAARSKQDALKVKEKLLNKEIEKYTKILESQTL